MQPINANQSLAANLAGISENFNEVHTIATTLRASDNNSGLAAPVLMEMGADNQHWVKPAGAVGPYIVMDHGFFLNASQYTEVDGEVVLNYVPATAYAITIAWGTTKAGITRPVSLVQHDSLGSRYWLLPLGYGSNVMIFDQGRLLDRDSFRIENNIIVLDYTPQLPLDIAASWGMGGPGLTSHRYLEKASADVLDVTHFLIPKNASNALLVTDYGIGLSAQDYTVDPATGILTLSYVPAEPLRIAASWGYDMDGLFMEATSTLQAPDGSLISFVLDQEPQVNSIQLREVKTDGSVVFYDLYKDFTVEGRKLTFLNGIIPAGGSTLIASMATSVFTSQSTLTSVGEVVLDPAIYLDTNLYAEEYAHNADGSISSITFKESGTIVKTINYNYTVDGRLNTKVEVGAGKTITRTYNYDGSGTLLNVGKTVI